MNLNKKTYITLAGFSGISLLLVVFIIYPFFKGIKKSSQEFLGVRKDLVIFKSKTQQASISKEKLQILKLDLEKIQNLFIDPEIPIDFLQFLENAARDSNAFIEISLLPKKTEETTLFPFLNFQLSLIGPFTNCLKFLEKLETAPYLIEMGDLTTQRLTESHLRSEKYAGLSIGDAEFTLSVKIFTK